jgi:LuxR family maltose regulon positive regulatory protein
MAKRPVASWAGIAASENDVLLATKLYLPHLQPGFVPRSRLVDMLEDAPAGGLALVCAPAGFGKTALLGDWARRGGRAVAWLSLDAGDSDPVRFWRHVVAALDRVRPGITERVAPLLGPPPPPSFEGLVTALINELAAAPTDPGVLLVLDDYHLIDSAPVHASVTFLLEHLPPGLHLVLASRADPPLALARLRARGRLAELRAAELRFTVEEAAALLREAAGAAGADLPKDALAALETRTEGWAAGLQLAALSLRGQADVAAFVATFSGSHRYVLDYLTEEVLERQTEQVRGFLLETSVLERLSGELCDAVTGRSDGQAMLEAVEAAGLFLVPLDEVRGWWRYHHLFADLLRTRLRRQQPSRVAVLRRAAAVWHDERGLADEAVLHALGADDPTWAARLMERHADALLFRSEGATVQRWLAALPAAVVESRPRLLLSQARLALLSRRVEAAEVALNAAEHAWTATPAPVDERFEPAVGLAASQLANVPAAIALGRTYLAALHGDAEGMASFASRALAGIGEHEWMLESIARWNLALAEWLHGRLAEAERGLSSTVSLWKSVGERGLGAVLRDHLGQVQRARGRLDAAHRTYQRTLAASAPPNDPDMPAAGVAHVGLAEVAYERNELDTSLRHVTEGVPLCRQFVYTRPLAAGLATLAWIRQANGDPGGAREAMEEAGRAAPGPEVTVLLNPIAVQRTRLQLAQGDLAVAARWTQQRGLNEDDEPGYPREPEYLVLARVLLGQDRPNQALPLLGRLHAGAAGQGRTGSVIEIRALQALALAACGDTAAAVDALAEALTLARPQGYVRAFADEGAPMRALLGRLIAAQRSESARARAVPLDYLARLLLAFDGEHIEPGTRQAARATALGLVEPLTARETEVLGLLAAGKSNPRIAEELVVTLDTVKKHVGHILDKLGAANRTEAVIRGQQLGLIS